MPEPLKLVPELGGECQCGRGETIGTCYVTRGRLLFRAFHDGPAAYHLANAADWRCVDCIGNIAMMVALATDEVRAWVQQRFGDAKEQADA